MADVSFIDFASTTPVATDQLVFIDDPGGTPVEGRATIAAVIDASNAVQTASQFTSDNRIVRTDRPTSDNRQAQQSTVTLDDAGNLSGVGTLNGQPVLQNNLSSTGTPGAGDDNTLGYAVGSLWIDTSTQRAYICLSAATAAAVWNVVNIPVVDSTPLVYDPADNTKRMRIDVGAVQTASTAVLLMPRVSRVLQRDNLSASVNPSATDDSAAGYALGSRWFNTTAGTVWICIDGTASAAVWIQYAPAPSAAPALGVSKGATVLDPTASDNITLFYAAENTLVTSIQAVILGSSAPDITWTVRFDADRSATGTELVVGGTLTDSTTTGSNVTTFDDDEIPAGSWVWLETTATTGTVDQLSLTLQVEPY
jgi:hypothetical protein